MRIITHTAAALIGAATLAVSLTGAAAANTYEDGSGRIGGVTWCIPGALCDDDLHYTTEGN